MTENERQPVRAFTVDETAAGERLDKFLSTVCPDLTRSAAARVIEEGGVLLNGAPGNKKDKLRPGTRVELRSPDPSCNPYLAVAACLAAGLDGIQRKLPLPEAVNRNLFHPSAAAGLESLPHTLREAITVAGQSEFISAELPVALQNKYFEYQTQLCHNAESAPDTEAWERAHSFLII